MIRGSEKLMVCTGSLSAYTQRFECVVVSCVDYLLSNRIASRKTASSKVVNDFSAIFLHSFIAHFRFFRAFLGRQPRLSDMGKRLEPCGMPVRLKPVCRNALTQIEPRTRVAFVYGAYENDYFRTI